MKYLKTIFSAMLFLIISSIVYEATLQGDKQITLSEFNYKLENNEIDAIESIYSSNNGKIYAHHKSSVYMLICGTPELQNEMIKRTLSLNKDIKIDIKNEINPFSSILMLIFSILPTLLFIAFLVYFSSSKGGAGGMFFTEERAAAKKPNTKFTDVQGVDEAKMEMQDIVDFLKNPLKYKKIGAKIPRGCLLIGEPGTGKTLMSKAIAGEANVPFFDTSGSEFIELFSGMGAKRIRELFAKAKKNAPCIIFIDEIDSIAKSRSNSAHRSNDEADQTLNQILTEMDGFNTNAGIIVIGATNRPDVLDKALLRAGRFDRHIKIDLPDLQGRKDILNVHLKNVKHDDTIDVSKIAKITAGMSGADLMNIINEAALMAARAGAKEVTSHHIDEANDRVIMGLKRRNGIMTEKDKQITAYHEAGHAILTYYSSHQKIHKITIIPRGMALGMVAHVKDKDDIHMTQSEMKDRIAISMAGRIAEEMIFGKDNITAGASSDIEQATKIANAMIRLYGMSNKVGRVKYDDTRHLSEDKKSIIDSEITKIIEDGCTKAQEVLIKYKDKFELLTQELLKKETLFADEVEKLLGDNQNNQ